MKIQYLSDLHIEFTNYTRPVPPVEGDVLVLAGDITMGDEVTWINQLPHEHIVYVLGNHEFYGGDIGFTETMIRNSLDPRVHVLNRESVEIEGVTFHGATMWTDYNGGNPLEMNEANNVMNDHRMITDGDNRFMAEDAMRIWNVSKIWLDAFVKPGDVVVTHHAPCYGSISEQFSKSGLNGAFYSDLTDIMLDHNPALWIHGHVHNSFDYMIGDTRVVCNPAGYPGEHTNDREFRDYTTVEI